MLLENHLVYQLALVERQERQRAETAPLLPFADGLLALHDARRDLVPVVPAAAARTLTQATKVVDSLRTLWEPTTDSAARAKNRAAQPRVNRTVANRGAVQIDQLRGTLRTWYRFYDGYDPNFTWWARQPYARLDSALIRYARTLRERVVGIPAQVAQRLSGGAAGPGDEGANDGPIIGDPIGAEGLKADLAHEMIPYTPDELVAIA
ncbi:MAG: hypothetical protein HY275_10295 [Gemmatimonadetes bacterium]|nr:hypothetical protein [Gemmatimonadota bacterium]